MYILWSGILDLVGLIYNYTVTSNYVFLRTFISSWQLFCLKQYKVTTSRPCYMNPMMEAPQNRHLSKSNWEEFHLIMIYWLAYIGSQTLNWLMRKLCKVRPMHFRNLQIILSPWSGEYDMQKY